MLLPVLMAVSPAAAQAPLLQDGALALRQARLDWALGQEPMGPPSLPSFEVGYGGAGTEGAYTPLTGGEGLGTGTPGWGLGLQGRYVRGGWSFSATALALRDHNHTVGLLQRAALAYQSESGWRAALEQTPFTWGTGLNGGDLMGDSFRPFPRLSLTTPEATLALGRWRAEAFAGKLEENPPIPAWLADREARLAAQASGIDLHRATLTGALVRASFGDWVETNLGALRMAGGQDAREQPAPSSAIRHATLLEVRLRLPAFASLARARGASAWVSRGAKPESAALSLAPSRDLAGIQLVWDAWDLALEYAGAAPQKTFKEAAAAYLAEFSTRGDGLGPAFGDQSITRTVELGLPLFLEGRGRLKLIRATSRRDAPSGPGSWFLQGDAQWRTPTGKVGMSIASRRNELAAGPGWGWSFSIFQSFRVF